jgi:peptidoglycan/xylan/chitin deacetylase (PgdA/CDA1 family)
MYIFLTKKELIIKAVFSVIVSLFLITLVVITSKNNQIMSLFDFSFSSLIDSYLDTVIIDGNQEREDMNKNIKSKVALLLNTSKRVVLGASFDYASSVPVLSYHGIVDLDDNYNVDKQRFIEHLVILKQQGWKTINFDDFCQYLTEGKRLPDKSFLLTFDDGRKDTYHFADPVLEALDYRAVMFVITAIISEEDDFHLSENELRAMLDSGRWELQSHGKNSHSFAKIGFGGEEGHFLSNKLWIDLENRLETDEEYRARIRKDLLESKTDLETKFGVEVNAFAFPFGDYGQVETNFTDSWKVIKKETKSIYNLAFYQSSLGNRLFNYPEQDGFMIRRITIKSDWNARDLLSLLTKYQEKDLDYIDKFKENTGWVNDWGVLRRGGNILILSANENAQSASTFLLGSRSWSNYKFTAFAELQGGMSYSLRARINEKGDYVSCNYNSGEIKFVEYVDGLRVEGNKWTRKMDYILGNTLEVAIRVVGNEVSCELQGVTMVKDRIERHTDLNGMVGISVWGQEKGDVRLVVQEVRVEAIPIAN